MQVTTVGLDLAKHWFQVHGVDAAGKVVVKRTRPSMRFVPVKSVDQQAVLMLHRGRALLVRQRTMLVNALRAHMAEFGFIAAKGLAHVEELVAAIEDDETAIPELALSILRVIVA